MSLQLLQLLHNLITIFVFVAERYYTTKIYVSESALVFNFIEYQSFHNKQYTADPRVNINKASITFQRNKQFALVWR